MILYDKLRLINWHYFLNETIDIAKITFLTGANGTGKSTLIDAMQIVLLGDTAGRNFNKAASEKTGRTMRGYLRGETGETDSGTVICLRPGRFSSYVALQFYDDQADRHFTLGIVFDCYENETETHQFFYIDDGFPPHNFTNSDLLDAEKKRALTSKELAQYCRQTYPENRFRFFDSNSAYQQFIKERLGNLPDKYFTLFKKAVGFTPITNIASFITEFVCDIDYHVDIAPMQSNIEQYKLLELQAKELQGRLDKLTEIHNAYAEFAKIKSDMALSEYIVDRANYEVARENYEASVDAAQKAQLEIESSKAQIREAKVALDDLKSEKEQYIGKKLGLAGFSVANGLSAKKNELTNKITALTLSYEANAAKIRDYLSSYERSAREMLNTFEDYDFSFVDEATRDRFYHLLEIAEDVAGEAAEVKSSLEVKSLDGNLLRDFQSLMQSFHDEAADLARTLESCIFDKQRAIDGVSAEMLEMKKGRKPYNSRYLELKSNFESALKARHSDAFVDTYCDLIDITDDTWTQAIESVLYSSKFNFFVNDQYYEEANKILANLAERMNYFSVSLVDASRLIDRGFQAKRGSLAEVVETSDEGARAYTNFLLGNIKRCHTFQEARESGNGLMPNCTGYHNFATWYLNKSRGEVNFIGTAISSDTIIRKKDSLDSLNREFSRLAELGNHLRSVVVLEVMSLKECESYVDIIEQQAEIKTLEASIDRYNEELSEGDLTEVKAIEAKIAAIDADIEELDAENEQLHTRIGELTSQLNGLRENLIPNQQAMVQSYQEKLTRYDAEFVDSTCIPFFENARNNLPLSQIKDEANRNYAQKLSKLRGSKDRLLSLRSRYVSERHLNYDISSEAGNEEFEKELTALAEVELPAYRDKIATAHEKAVKEFKDDFIYKLRTSIETVRTQIEELNVALKDIKFGRDSYRFSVTPNRDYQEYYDMITDDLLLNVGDTEDLFFKKYSVLIQNLIDLITSANTAGSSAEQKSQILANIDKFTDYRTYLVFDLKVKSGESEIESSLARTFKRKSGGETQTPFYISILASFAQLYRVNKAENNNTIRLVIFDEAFSKMDAARIIESVGLLRSFDLQVILSTPSEKIRDLAKEVDLTLVAHHLDREKRSYIDKLKETNKDHRIAA